MRLTKQCSSCSTHIAANKPMSLMLKRGQQQACSTARHHGSAQPWGIACTCVVGGWMWYYCTLAHAFVSLFVGPQPQTQQSAPAPALLAAVSIRWVVTWVGGSVAASTSASSPGVNYVGCCRAPGSTLDHPHACELVQVVCIEALRACAVLSYGAAVVPFLLPGDP